MLDQFHLYVPGGGQAGPNLEWSQRHDYDDVKMSRLGTGAASGMMSAVLGIGSDTISNAAGLAGRTLFRTQINPYVEVLYRGTDLRAFDFSFMLAPQSAADAQQLYGFGAPITTMVNGVETVTNEGAGTGYDPGLLNRFRYHAAPEFIGPASSLFKSPSEWEIDFLYKGADGAWRGNNKLPKIAKGVLVRVDVDYSPDSEFSTFENGGPTSARLTMRFVEMEIIDKGRIGQGF